MFTQREKLLKEYIKRFNSRWLMVLRMSGFIRVEIKDGAVTEKSLSVSWRGAIIIFLQSLSASCLYYEALYKNHYGQITEMLTLMILLLIQDFFLINIIGPNRNSGVKLLNNCIDLDVLLGVKETKFMRVISDRILIISDIFILVGKIFSIFGVIYTFYSYLLIVIFATTFIVILIVVNDFSFLFYIFVFLTLRVRYLNVALIKSAKLNPGIFPKGFVLGELLWKANFDDLVSFHERSDLKQFLKAFKLIFRLVEETRKAFRFVMLIGLIGILSTALVLVQGLIIYIKSADTNPFRLFAIAGWVLTAWLFAFGIILASDIFHGQIEKTTLICVYVKLTHEMPKTTLKLVGSVLNVLKTYNTEISVYGVMSLRTRSMVRVTLSLLVYIVMEIQLGFPVSNSNHVLTLNTTVPK